MQSVQHRAAQDELERQKAHIRDLTQSKKQSSAELQDLQEQLLSSTSEMTREQFHGSTLFTVDRHDLPADLKQQLNKQIRDNEVTHSSSVAAQAGTSETRMSWSERH